MARMAASQRLELGDKMVEAWTTAGYESHTSCRFVQDMLGRMRSGKGMSPKQRTWFDSAVVSDPPQSYNTDLVQKLRSAKEVPGMEEQASVLEDFVYRMQRGFQMTEKQMTFMNSLLEQAEHNRTFGPWVPTEEERKSIETVVGICRRYSSCYLNRRPGLGRALLRCIRWLNGTSKVLDKRSAEVVMSAAKTTRRIIEKFVKDHPPGTLVEHFSSNALFTVISEPFGNASGLLVISALNGGKVVEMPLAAVKK